jgi:cell division protein FtsB
MWKLIGATILAGMVTGFALPIAASYQTEKYYVPRRLAATPEILKIPTAPDPDSEIARLRARNRELEAQIASLSNHPANRPK